MRVKGFQDRDGSFWPRWSAVRYESPAGAQCQGQQVYHSPMRRFILCWLICCLPLQAWTATSFAHGFHGNLKAPVLAVETAEDLPCHTSAHGAEAGGPSQTADPVIEALGCDDCQTCDLCHLAWSFFLADPLPVLSQRHVLPFEPITLRASRHWPPPLEPPRI